MKTKILLILIQILSPSSGKVTVYLGKRDFTVEGEHVDPIDGVVVVDNDYLKGRKVYGRVTTTYRYGREEDEVMGVKFSKELVLANQQIVPSAEKAEKLTLMQVKKVFICEYLLHHSCSDRQIMRLTFLGRQSLHENEIWTNKLNKLRN
jgi:hypothetical protein